jgi:enoyl-CoA hydratase/carnithine racemase
MDDSDVGSCAPGSVSCEVRDRIAVVRIDHPPLNTLDVATKEALRDAFGELDRRREDIRAVVLAGAGRGRRGR